MGISDKHHSTWLRTTLAALLLMVQGLAFAHDIGHLDKPGTDSCITCSLLSDIGSPADSPALDVTECRGNQLIEILETPELPFPHFLHQDTRAPPEIT